MPSEAQATEPVAAGAEGGGGPTAAAEASTGPAVSGMGASLADRACDALWERIDAFRRAVATAEQEVRRDLLRRTGIQSYRGEQALIELGPFAAGRIDPDRFAMLLGIAEEELTPESIDVLGRADHVLADFADHSTHRVTVQPGGDLRDVVKHGLAQLGQAFGAARAVELARAGSFEPHPHGHLLGPLPFRLWNRAERRLAPPLLVEVRGEDCLPAGLGEFLDGAVTLVLVATGPTTPAPLARLVTPGTFVMQTADVADLERIGRADHPAVVLLFDADRPGQAHFVHDPDAGDAPWSRLTVSRMPADASVGRGHRAPAWLEELVHLKTLSEVPAGAQASPGGAGSIARTAGAAARPAGGAAAPAEAASTGPTESPVAEPADRLAAWLLAQTDVSDL